LYGKSQGIPDTELLWHCLYGNSEIIRDDYIQIRTWLSSSGRQGDRDAERIMGWVLRK